MSRCWLTGASSGIGAALAHILLEQGHQVALGGRHADRLAPLAEQFPGQVLLAIGDLDNPEQVAAIAERIEQAWGGLDMAILNAGTCEYLEPGHFDPALVERVMRTNLLGVSYCLAAAVPLLRTGQRPHLVVMGSSVTWLALPRAGAYGASKAAVRYLVESQRIDLAREGIAVTLVSPARRHATDPSQRFPHAAAVDCTARRAAYRHAPAPAASGNQLPRSFHPGIAPGRGVTRAPALGTRPTPRPS